MRLHLWFIVLCVLNRSLLPFILVCSQSNCTFVPLCSLLSVLQCCSYSPLFSVSINLIVELPEYCYSILMHSARSVTVNNKRSGVQTHLCHSCSSVLALMATAKISSAYLKSYVITALMYASLNQLLLYIVCMIN